MPPGKNYSSRTRWVGRLCSASSGRLNRIELRDSELSTITAAADKVLLIKDEPNWIVNVEFLSWPDACAAAIADV